MNISLTGRRVKITPEMRNYLEKNMKKLDHFSDFLQDFQLVIEKEKHIYIALVNIAGKRKKNIHIFARSEDPYGVLDDLFDKVEVKLKRYKDKLTSKRKVSLKESGSEA